MRQRQRLRLGEGELSDLVKAWLAISLAFAIVLNRSVFSSSFTKTFLLAAVTVGLGFLLHELAHKIVAQHYGYSAQFQAFNAMLLLALAMSFLGFVFAAPGAVMIRGFNLPRDKNGKISLAGPATNIALAFVFLLLSYLTPYETLTGYGILINSWLAVFNMIPFGNFDGSKVLRWSKSVYIITVILAIMFLILA